MSGYSACVRSTLTIDGQCYTVASIGPDTIKLRGTAVGHTHTIHAGAVGELTIAVDRAATRYSVRLPYGATLGHEARYDQLTDPIQFTQGRVYVKRGNEIEDVSKGKGK